VAGVPAYSTLGWFDDPVMNTMMHWQDYDLVGTLFHELAHQKFYIQGDTIFNESLAKAIEQEGLRRWMDRQSDSKGFRDYLQDAQRERQFIDMVLKTRNKLEDLYRSDLSPATMSVRKLEIFRGLRADYRQLRQQWGGYDVYDRWVFSGVNNAKIQSIATYYDYVPAFESMLQRHQGDLLRFYEELGQIMTMGQKERREYLLTMLDG
jgi:predicted aminopeptidase